MDAKMEGEQKVKVFSVWWRLGKRIPVSRGGNNVGNEEERGGRNKSRQAMLNNESREMVKGKDSRESKLLVLNVNKSLIVVSPGEH